jgi:acyl-CoA synthetase (AMP-forming)/AMP-acid ligase II
MLEAGNIWELIVRRAEETPEREMAVDESGRRLSFGDYRRRCERVAAALAARGVAEGAVVSWILPTWLEAMVLFGALRRLGAVQNPILPIYREREVGFIVRQATPALLVVPGTWRGFDYRAMVEPLVDGTSTMLLTCDRSLPEGDPTTLPPAPGDDMRADGAPARYLYYTSGTTADPKGARHGDRALGAAALGMAERLQLTADDRFAFVFPISHIAGGVYLYASLANGLTFVLDEAFDPASTIELLRRERITQAGAGTFFHQAYLRAQRELPAGEKLFPHVRAFPGGGAPKPPQLHYDLKAAFGGAGIVSGYGLTEAPILTMNDADANDVVLAETEGPAVDGVALRIVTLDGQEAAPGEEGEVRAKGPQVTLGYLDPALDADAFDDDGWFRTGDLGRLDRGGNLTITGRLKDVIIRKGENVSAKEVEDLLFTHPSVADVAVIGLPDSERGERVCAVVVPQGDPGAAALSLDDVTRHLRDAGLSARKLPEQLEIVDTLPRNPTGKVLKPALRQRFARPLRA